MCQLTPSGSSGRFATASWTRFSPRSVTPAATASATRSGTTVLETATSRTAAGSRPARSAAAVMRARAAAIAPATSSVVGAMPGV